MSLSPNEFQHTVDLMRGTIEPDSVLTAMQDFFRQEFDCELYDYFADTLPEGGNRLRYVIWDSEAGESFFIHTETFYGRDKEKENKIKEEFSRLCRQENILDSFHDPHEYFAVATEIADELRTNIQHQAEKEIRHYLETIPQICRYEFFFDTVHVFYQSDEDIERHHKDGLSQAISNRILELKKPYDEFNALVDSGTCFSSIQTLNEKYEGNVFYYFR